MKTTRDMNDAERIAVWGQITDPYDALREIAEHEIFLGSDCYYSDLHEALIGMAARVAKNKPKG